MPIVTSYSSRVRDIVSARATLTIDFAAMTTVTRNRVRAMFDTGYQSYGWSSKTAGIADVLQRKVPFYRGVDLGVLDAQELELLQSRALLAGVALTRYGSVGIPWATPELEKTRLRHIAAQMQREIAELCLPRQARAWRGANAEIRATLLEHIDSLRPYTFEV